MSNYAEKNISTKQSSESEEARISCADGNQRRTRRIITPSGEGAQTSHSASLLETDFRLPKAQKLRKPREFKLVYAKGKRYEGRFLTAFVFPNQEPQHRLGITASRKGIGNAVQRNRAKRLLREAFRLSKSELCVLTRNYDFVLNARRSLLKVKMKSPLGEFQEIIKRIRQDETIK
jgi:ribonuclease P protein component